MAGLSYPGSSRQSRHPAPCGKQVMPLLTPGKVVDLTAQRCSASWLDIAGELDLVHHIYAAMDEDTTCQAEYCKELKAAFAGQHWLLLMLRMCCSLIKESRSPCQAAIVEHRAIERNVNDADVMKLCPRSLLAPPCGHVCGTGTRRLCLAARGPASMGFRMWTQIRPHEPCWLNGRSASLFLPPCVCVCVCVCVLKAVSRCLLAILHEDQDMNTDERCWLYGSRHVPSLSSSGELQACPHRDQMLGLPLQGFQGGPGFQVALPHELRLGPGRSSIPGARPPLRWCRLAGRATLAGLRPALGDLPESPAQLIYHPGRLRPGSCLQLLPQIPHLQPHLRSTYPQVRRCHATAPAGT